MSLNNKNFYVELANFNKNGVLFMEENLMSNNLLVSKKNVIVNFDNTKMLSKKKKKVNLSKRKPSLFKFLLKKTKGSVVEVGRVMAIKDSVIVIEGMPSVKMFECIHFVTGDEGVILNLEKKNVKGLCFSAFIKFLVNDPVYTTGSVMSVKTGYFLLGNILNPLGKFLTKKQKVSSNTEVSINQIERKAPGVITRLKIKRALYTGVKIVDALVPIGRGQRELILGDRKSGKTSIAIDTILNQKYNISFNKDSVFCVYCTIGKRMAEVKRIFKVFSMKACLSFVIMVVTTASDSAALQYIAPYSATTMAEFFTYKGKDSLIIYDDLTKHADVYRQLSLLLRRPVGREAFPGDVFYCHSRLLERSVNMSSLYGAGSLTSLPIVETIQGDVSAYIPTNIISITDGQIFLDLARHQSGFRPAVDPGISVSRIGSAVQSKAMKTFSGSLKLQLAQHREIESFAKFNNEMDDVARQRLIRGRLLVDLLLQNKHKPLPMYLQTLLLFATNTGYFDTIKKSKQFNSIADFEESLRT